MTVTRGRISTFQNMYTFQISYGFVIIPLMYYWIIGNVGGVEAVTKIPVVVPVSKLIEGRAVPITHSYISTYPAWVNLTLLDIGQSFLHDNFLSFTYGLGIGGAVGYNPDLIRVVIGIGDLTNLSFSVKRFLSNALNIKYWSVANPIQDHGNLFEALNLIHAVHARVDAQAFEKAHTYSSTIIPNPKHGSNPHNLNLEAWDAFEANLKASSLKAYQFKPLLFDSTNLTSSFRAMNQLSLTSVLWTFVSVPILYPEKLYIFSATEEELMGFLHLFAFVGHALGVEDQYNICFQPNLASAERYLKEMFDIYFLPYLFQLDYEFKLFVEIQMLGFLNIIPFDIKVGFLLAGVCDIVLDIECPSLQATLSPQERFYTSFYKTLGRVHTGPIKSSLRFIGNGLLQVATLRTYNFNTLRYDNFTAGLLEMNEKVLARSSEVYDDAN